MKENKNIIINTLYIVIGAILLALSLTGKLNNLFSGFGGGLIGVGILQLTKAVKYKTNSNYKAKVDTEVNDERNRFISMKAWSWAGYSFVIICAVIAVVCLIVSQTLYMQIASSAICVMLVLYYIAYLIVRKKY